jgi:hypothetical protein
LNYSQEGELVLDPMGGSGATLIEARLLKRNAAGYDISAHAAQITRERLAFDVPHPARQMVSREETIKTPHNTTYSQRWTGAARSDRFYLIMYEHLYVFRKPRAGEDLIRHSVMREPRTGYRTHRRARGQLHRK